MKNKKRIIGSMIGSAALGGTVVFGAVAQACEVPPTTNQIIENARDEIIFVFTELSIYNLTRGSVISDLTRNLLSQLSTTIIENLNNDGTNVQSILIDTFSFSNVITSSEIQYTSALNTFQIEIFDTNIGWTSGSATTGIVSGNLIFTFEINDDGSLTLAEENIETNIFPISGIQINNNLQQITIAAGINRMLSSGGLSSANPIGFAIFNSLLENANVDIPEFIPGSEVLDASTTEVLNLSFNPIEPSRVELIQTPAPGEEIYRARIGNENDNENDNSFFMLTSSNFENSGPRLSFLLSPTSILFQAIPTGGFQLINENTVQPIDGIDRPINSFLITILAAFDTIGIDSDIIQLATRFLAGDSSTSVTGLNELYQYSFTGLEPPILSGAGITLGLLEIAIRELLNEIPAVEFVFVTSIDSLNPISLDSIDSFTQILDIANGRISFDLSGLSGRYARTNENGIVNLSEQFNFSVPEGQSVSVSFAIPTDANFSSISAEILNRENIVV